MSGRAAAFCCLALGAMTACTVGPDYRSPADDAPARWGATPGGRTTMSTGDVDLSWWQSFHDPELTSLVGRLGLHNLALKEAAARIDAARAQVRIAAAHGVPSLDWAGSYTWNQQSPRGILSMIQPRPWANPQYDYYQNIVSAGWDLDLFGMIRRGVEAQSARADAAVAARRATALAIVADLATTYLRLRGTQEQRALTERHLALVQHDLGLVHDRARAGAATALDLAEARARVARTHSALAPFHAQEAALINALGALLALPPRALESELAPIAPQPSGPLAVPVGVPSVLAARRPDIMLAGARLHEATAHVGMAKASFYPDITLVGNLGTQSLSAGDFLLPGARYFTLGPTLHVPIFEGGRLTGTLRLSESAQKAAALAYRQTVLDAWREVDDAMTAYARLQEQRSGLAEAVRQDRLALTAARQRYRSGAVAYLEVDEAEARLLVSQVALAAVQARINTGLVALYRALGGGWQFAETGSISVSAPGPDARAVRVKG